MSNEIGRLISLAGLEIGDREFIVREKEYFIGGSINCNLRIRHENITERQCVIKATGNKVSITNLNLDEPVYLNDKPIGQGGNIIGNDDNIRILDKTFKWKYNAERNCLSTSQLLDSPVHEAVPTRFSEPCFVSSDVYLNDEEVEPILESLQSKQEDEAVVVAKEMQCTPKANTLPKKPYISTSCRITRSSVESVSAVKRLASTCIKPRKVRNIVNETSKATKLTLEDRKSQNSGLVKTLTKKGANNVNVSRKSLTSSPFAVVTNSRKEMEEKSELELEISGVAKTANGDNFEDDSTSSHSGASQPFHSTPKPTTGMKYVDTIQSPLSSSVDFNFELSAGDDCSKLEANDLPPEANQVDEAGDTNSEVPNSLNPTSTISTENNLRQRSSVLRKTFDDESYNESSMHLMLEVTKGNTTSKKSFTGSTPTKRVSEICNESRRNTRGRTSMLRKTFEEKTCDGDNKEKSLTTPEKSTEMSTMKSTMYASESGIDNTIDTRSDLKFVGESSKSGFISIDENETFESSFIDKYKMCNVVKAACSSPVPTAKCARNLSYISPPENNRSQEYMESMVSTPKKSPSVQESMNESYNVTMPSQLLTSKDGSMLNESMLSPLSSARKRRSTGFVPFVGTPSNVYRTARKMSTPFNKSCLSRTSTDFETNIERLRGRKRSVERRSTPYKANARKSSMRDSVSLHPPIKESISFEEMEASTQDSENEPMNDSKFRFVTVRRRYRCGESDFATENKILEESELQNDDTESDDSENDSLDDNENSLEESLETPTSTRITANSMSMLSQGFDDVSAVDKTKLVEIRSISELKSILTPLPKTFSTMKDKSAKRVTFVLPSSPECSMIEQNTELNNEESFAMISCSRKSDFSETDKTGEIGTDEELYESDKSGSDISYSSASVTEDDISNMDDKSDETSTNLTGVGCLLETQQTSSADLSGVEHIASIDPSPVKIDENEVESVENITEVKTSDETANQPQVIPKQSKTNQHYSPGVFLSGVKSLLTTPKPSTSSSKCTLNFEQTSEQVTSSAQKIADVENPPVEKEHLTSEASGSPEVCLSGVKSLLKTPEKKHLSSAKASKRNLCFKGNVTGKPTPTDKTTQAPTNAPHLIRKSVGVSKVSSVKKTPRMCKSLNMNEVKAIPIEVNEVENVPKESQLETTKIVSEENFDNDEIASVANESSTEIFTNVDIPKIMITEATFVDNNSSPEIEKSNEVEHGKPDNVLQQSVENIVKDVLEKETDTNSAVMPPSQDAEQDDSVNFETSDIEDQYEPSNHDDTISSDNSVLEERSESPVLMYVNRKSTRTPLSMTTDNEISPVKKDNISVNMSVVAESVNEIQETNEQNDSSSSSDHSEKNETLPEAEISGEIPLSESKSSLEVMVSDRDSSRLSDVQSVDDNIDAENVKSKDDNDNPIEKKSADEKITTDTLDESALESTINSQDVDIKIDVSSDLVNELDDELEDDSPVVNRSVSKSLNENLGIPGPDETPNLIDSNKKSCSQFTENPSSTACHDTPNNLPSRNEADLELNIVCKTPLQSTSFVFPTPKTDFTFSSIGSPSSVRRCTKSQRIHRLSTNSLNQSLCNTTHNCSISSDISMNEANIPDNTEKSKEPQEMFKDVVTELKSKFNENKNEELVEAVSPKVGENIQKPDYPESLEQSTESIKNDYVETNDTTVELVHRTQGVIEPDSLVIDVPNLETIISIDVIPVEYTNSSVSPRTINSKDESEVELTTSSSQSEISQTNFKICLPSSSEQQPVEKISIGSTEKCLIEEADSTNKSLIVSLPRSQDVSVNIKQIEETLSIQAPQRKRSMRLRRGKNAEIESTNDLEDGIQANQPKLDVTETKRRRGRPLLKANRKDAVIEHKGVQDNKENVCALLEVLEKSRPKRIKLSEETVAEASTRLEKPRRKTRRLKNVENLSTDSDENVPSELPTQRGKRALKKSPVNVPSKKKRGSVETTDEVGDRCSIVLPVLDPEIVRRSPVKVDVDEDGNFSLVIPSEASKGRRATRVTKKTVNKPAAPATGESVLRTIRQKQKTVSFKSISPSQKKTAVKTTTANKVATTAANHDKVVPAPKPAARRTTRNQNNDVEMESQELEKKTRSKRAVKLPAILSEMPKRTRTKAKEVIKTDSKEIPVEPPKRTRTKTKEVVETEPSAPSSRPKRGAKSNLEEPTTSQKSTENVTKNPPKLTRRGKNIAQSTESEKCEEYVAVKSTQAVEKVRAQKVTKNLEPIVPVEKAITRKRVTKADSVDEDSKRTTRGRKKETVDLPVLEIVDIKESQVGRAKATRLAKNKIEVLNQPSTSKSKSELSPKAADSKAVEKRRIVTKSKKVSLTKKGRVSLTLKTTSRLSFTKLLKTNRLTRSKAK